MINDVFAQEGLHEIEIKKLFGDRFFYTGGPVFSWPLYVILFTNRSGSNLLAEYLVSTKKLRGLTEMLNKESVENHVKRNKIESFSDYIIHLSNASDNNTPYGFKASVEQLFMLRRSGITRLYEGLRLITIERNDVISQAVSFSIADQTKQWSSLHEKKSDNIVFDFDNIEKIITATVRQNGIFPYVANILGADCYHCKYEDLIQDPETEIRNICDLFDIDHLSWSLKEPNIKKQRNHINEDFRKKYIEILNKTI